MTNLDIIFGPAVYNTEANPPNFTTGYALNDSNDAQACIFQFPKSGTIEDIGFFITVKTGNPPDYKVGLTTVNISGHPQQTAYGGSSIDDFTYTTSGWIWHTLATPASVAVGETAAVHVFPGSTPPDTSNFISIQDGELFFYATPINMTFTTSWLVGLGPNAMAIRYDSGDIAGFPVIASEAVNTTASSTPDEIGDKFTLPIDMTCKGARILVYNGINIATFDAILYSASDTVLASRSGSCGEYGADYVAFDVYWDTPIVLSANTTYRLTLKATGSDYLALVSYTFESESSRDTLTYPESSRWYKTERTDGGAWTDYTNKITHIGLLVSAISVGGEGGGDGTSRFGFAG